MGCPSVTRERGQAATLLPLPLVLAAGKLRFPFREGGKGKCKVTPGSRSRQGSAYGEEKCHSASKPVSEQKGKGQLLKGDPGALGPGPAVPSFSAFWCIVDPKPTSYGLQRNRGARTQQLGRGLSSMARPVQGHRCFGGAERGAPRPNSSPARWGGRRRPLGRLVPAGAFRGGCCAALQALSPLRGDATNWSLRSGSGGTRSGDTSDRGEPGLCRPRAAEDRNVLPTLGGGRLSRVLLPSKCWTKASSESLGSLYSPFGSKKRLTSVTLSGCPYPSDKRAEILLNRGSFHPTPHLGTQPVGLTLLGRLCPWDVPGTVRDSPPGL